MSGIIKPPMGARLNPNHPLSGGLVGCWLFNEDGGDKTYDYSGQMTAGSLMNIANPPTSTSGWNLGPHGASVLALDGSNDYVNCGNSKAYDIAGDMNIIVLIKAATVAPSFQNILIKGDEYAINYALYLSGDEIWFQFYNAGMYTDSSAAANLAADTWYFLEVWFDVQNNVVKLFKNVTEVYSNTQGGNPVANAAALYFGYDSIPNRFNGSLGAVWIYDRLRSDDERSFHNAFPYCMFEDWHPAGLVATPPPKLTQTSSWRIFAPSVEKTSSWKISNYFLRGSAWAIAAPPLAQSSSWRIHGLCSRDSYWRIQNAVSPSAAWSICNSITKDSTWRVVTITQHESSWRILAQLSQSSSWAITTQTLNDAAWKIANVINQDSSWCVGIYAARFDSAWGIATTGTYQAVWRILNQVLRASAWGIQISWEGQHTVFHVTPLQHKFTSTKKEFVLHANPTKQK